MSFQKGIDKFVNGYRAKKWDRFCKKALRNSSMGTERKMGTSLQKGIKRFVNGCRAKKWERLCKKVLRNSSMGTG